MTKTATSDGHPDHSLFSRSAPQLLVIILIAALLCGPCLLDGVSGGYDSSTHVRYQHHFSQQFWNGDAYPRWLAESNKGLGSPIFLIQYPVPYFVTALLRPLTAWPDLADREARELGVLMFLAVAAAGLAARFWMRGYVSSLAATIAALIYMASPYMLICMYARAAIGELCALALMPLALGLSDSMQVRKGAGYLLALVVALLLLSNVLIAMLFVPALFCYAMVSASQNGVGVLENLRRLVLALVLAIGLACVYVLPVAAYRHLFDLGAMAANVAGFELGHYFIFTTWAGFGSWRESLAGVVAVCMAVASCWYAWRVRATRLGSVGVIAAVLLASVALIPGIGLAVIERSGFVVSKSAAWELFSSQMMLALFGTMFLGWLAHWTMEDRGSARDVFLLLLACAVFMMMLPFSAPLWKAIPALAVAQFPFRFGSILTVVVAGLAASAVDCALKRGNRVAGVPAFLVLGAAAAWATATAVLVFRMDYGFREHQGAVEYVVASDVDVMYRTYVPPEELRALAESMGTSPERHGVVSVPGEGEFRFAVTGDSNCVRVTRESPRLLRVSTDCEDVTRILIGQLYFPTWRLVALGNPTQQATLGVGRRGLMDLSVGAGRQDWEIVFDLGRPAWWGTLISGLSLLVVVAGLFWSAWLSRSGRRASGSPTLRRHTPP